MNETNKLFLPEHALYLPASQHECKRWQDVHHISPSTTTTTTTTTIFTTIVTITITVTIFTIFVFTFVMKSTKKKKSYLQCVSMSKEEELGMRKDRRKIDIREEYYVGTRCCIHDLVIRTPRLTPFSPPSFHSRVAAVSYA